MGERSTGVSNPLLRLGKRYISSEKQIISHALKRMAGEDGIVRLALPLEARDCLEQLVSDLERAAQVLVPDVIFVGPRGSSPVFFPAAPHVEIRDEVALFDGKL